ncbi:MAG: universal stress protein [Paracoccaceae bacterium]
MTMKIVIGIDRGGADSRSAVYAKGLAKRIGKCELIVVHVIEWSPYSFQTAEENAERHKRREQEIETAQARIVQPTVDALVAEGFKARGIVRHGNVADLLDQIAKQESADQIVVSRTSDDGLVRRIFGSVAANLVMHASVPVTVVG